MTKLSATALRVWVLVGMIVASIQLRGPITGVVPALSAISADLSLSPTLAGFVTSLPLICFGIFAFVTPFLSARFGLEPTMWVALFLVFVGLTIRPIPTLGTFFGGILLFGFGTALANVLLPALVRSWWAHRLALVMGLYTIMIQLSGGSGAFITPPLMAAGLPWTQAIGWWAVISAIALILWSVISVFIRQRTTEAHHTTPPSGLAEIIRRPQSWAVTFVMGTQSLIVFTCVAWIPTHLRNLGLAEAPLGIVLGFFAMAGLPASFLAVRLPQGRHGPLRLVILFAVYLIALALWWTNLVGAIIGMVLLGVCQGIVLVVALTFIATQRRPEDVPAVSALAQGVGYLYAAIGPVAVGALLAATGSLVPGSILMMVFTVLMGVVAIWVAREQHREKLATLE